MSRLKVGEGVAQGDLWIKRIAKKDVPSGLKSVERKHGKLIVAYGEATGHNHAVEEVDDVQVLQDLRDLEKKYIVVGGKAEAHLTHDEHDSHTFEPGAYVVTGQREHVEKDKPRPVYD